MTPLCQVLRIYMDKVWSLHSPFSGGIINRQWQRVCLVYKRGKQYSGRMDFFSIKKYIKLGSYHDAQLTNCIFCCGLLMVTRGFQCGSFGLETSP